MYRLKKCNTVGPIDLKQICLRTNLETDYPSAMALLQKNLASQNDGCDGQMNRAHALDCKNGGLVKNGNDQHLDHCAAMA